MPLGNDPIGNLLNDLHGGPACLIRRDAFEQVGGFPENSRMGEDYALLTRIAAAGFDSDVLPEYLCYHRDTQSGLMKSGLEFDAYGAVSPTPGDFAAIHLPSFDVTFRALEERRQRAERSLTTRRQALERRFYRGGTRGLRLLLLIPHWPYPPISGALAVMWERIRYLGQRHDVTLATFGSPGDAWHRHKLLRYCQQVYAVRRSGLAPPGTESWPFMVREHQSAEMHETLQSIPTRLFDAAVIDEFIMAPYLDDLEMPTILAEHCIFSTMLSQVSADRSYGQLTRAFENPKDEIRNFIAFEDSIWPRFPLRTAVSEVDRVEIQRRAKVGQTIVVEIGTDPGLRLNRLRQDTRNVLFVGMLSWYPNVDAVLYFWREIWPHLRRLSPMLHFVIAGYTPVPEIRALARESRVTVVASPRDIGPIADKTSVTVVPLRIGSGVRVKILNALSMGLPIVTTALGCEGLAVEDGEHLLIRDDPIAFAEAVHEVLSTPSLWQRLRRNGLELIEQHYRWDRVFDPLDRALWQLAARD